MSSSFTSWSSQLSPLVQRFSSQIQHPPTLLRPFLQLSYPVPRPEHPDSFPSSNYYDIGPLDACFIVSTMAVFAVLREIVRLKIMTPMANKLLFGSTKGYRPLYRRGNSSQSSLANGKKPYSNGHAFANGQKPYSNGHAFANGQKPNGANGLSNGSASTGTIAVNGNGNGNGHGRHYAARKMSAKNRVRERNVIRFAEQGWAIVYYTIWFSYGIYIHLSVPTSPWNLDHLWIGLPHNPLAGPLKTYYLTQCAFWLHQLLILNAEARRKDHVQMNAHHVITIFLVLASYSQNLTRVGCLILVLMDFCDIILPLAKMLRYLELPRLCDVAFVTFLVSWFLTRHVGFLLILWSTWHRYPIIRPESMEYGNEDPYTPVHYWAFNIALASLQLIMCVWFVTIVKVAWTVIRGKPAEDTRSDEELPSSSDDENYEIEEQDAHEKKCK